MSEIFRSAITCSNCGQKLTGTSNFCSKCGSPKSEIVKKPHKSTCYLCIKSGKSHYFSDTKKYKEHLKTEHFLESS